ncbi:7-cyano-7-deazaguanine synthase [hydrothermal vent metagenome]|uniref:7-cyano-7-deazaguanine synthase n=1 Tax=hydrothermal vent metagenome TaxID=652676 RepID=A0A3B1ABT8_9ZZZZ
MDQNTRKAVVLVSGGLDSATVLAIAKQAGHECYALSFDYGQRHRSELLAAKQVAEHQGAIAHRIFVLDLAQFGGSALTDSAIAVPTHHQEGIPVTYVPARNTVFLSIALAWAEVLGAYDIFIGVNAIDYSGYPDCRPEYIEAYQRMATLATKTGVEGQRIQISTPLLHLSKAEIIQRGMGLGVDFGLTLSCYNPDEQGLACGQCDSCRLRKEGFTESGIVDPTKYVSN